MTHSEAFAVNQWLSWYADSMTYAEIIAAMRDPENAWSCDDIDTWQLVQNLTLDQVADLIEDTRVAFENTIKHMKDTA
jgi:hypothetical protein